MISSTNYCKLSKPMPPIPSSSLHSSEVELLPSRYKNIFEEHLIAIDYKFKLLIIRQVALLRVCL